MSAVKYQYKSLDDIDRRTREYLEFVLPVKLSDLTIKEVNQYLTKLDRAFESSETKTKISEYKKPALFS